MKELFEAVITKGKIYEAEPMSRHTSFKTGGMADIFMVPYDEKELSEVISLCRKNNIPFYVIGNGSNLLVSDEGIRGAVIKIGEGFDKITVDKCMVTAEAGALLSKIANTALDKSLTGFEFAAGIPGSLGGAVTMNAGAYGGEMKDVIAGVKVMDYDGNILYISGKDMDFSYRHSKISQGGYIVLSAEISLTPGNYDDIKETMRDLSERRRSKQPLEYPSAGSTFKRPEGYFAGKLIMDAGFAGYRKGGAMVSDKHCGFVINAGGATTTDILELIKEVQKGVYDKFGVMLEPEVKILN